MAAEMEIEICTQKELEKNYHNDALSGNQQKKYCSNMTLCVVPAQPAGMPEILKKSLHNCSVRGGEEVFIIGKNFLKDTKVIFQENISGNAGQFWACSFFTHFSALLSLLYLLIVPDEKSWKAEAEIDMELFHQVFAQ